MADSNDDNQQLYKKGAPLNIDDVKVSIAFLCSYPNKVAPVVKYLARRGWSTYLTSSMNEMIQHLARKKPEFLMISVDHPSPKVAALPNLIAQMFNTHCVLFSEIQDRKSMHTLLQAKARFKYDGNVSGPAIHRKIFQMLTDIYTPSSGKKKNQGGFSAKEEERDVNIISHNKRDEGSKESIIKSSTTGLQQEDSHHTRGSSGGQRTNEHPAVANEILQDLTDEELLTRFQQALDGTDVFESFDGSHSSNDPESIGYSSTRAQETTHDDVIQKRGNLGPIADIHQRGHGIKTGSQIFTENTGDGSYQATQSGPSTTGIDYQDHSDSMVDISTADNSINMEAVEERNKKSYMPIPDKVDQPEIAGVFHKAGEQLKLPEELQIAQEALVEFLVVIPVEISSRKGYLCLPIRRFGMGAIKVAQNYKEILKNVLGGRGKYSDVYEALLVHVKPFMFREWVEKEALFSSYNDEEAMENQYCFVEHNTLLPELKECQMPGKHVINIKDIVVDKPVDFNLYFYMHQNQKYLLYLKVDRTLSQKRMENLEKRGAELSIDGKDIVKFYRYYVENIIAGKILELRRDQLKTG